MKSDIAQTYINHYRETLYTSQVWGNPIEAIRFREACEAVELAETDAALRSLDDQEVHRQAVLPILKTVRAMLLRSEASETDSKVGCAIMMLNKLLMK